jgi:hypothetical protein
VLKMQESVPQGVKEEEEEEGQEEEEDGWKPGRQRLRHQ